MDCHNIHIPINIPIYHSDNLKFRIVIFLKIWECNNVGKIDLVQAIDILYNILWNVSFCVLTIYGV